MFENIPVKRDSKGRIILDDFEKTDKYILGRKEKFWLKKGDKEFLFKSETVNYEMFAELIASELAQQCGFPTAKYDLAIYNGKVGVVSPNFLKKGEIINSGKMYLADAADVSMQNNLNFTFSVNSIDNILIALTIKENMSTVDLEVILMRLIEIWCFDLAILESDRNNTNWGIIKTFGSIKLSPIYDCSNMAKLNTNINESITRLRTSSQLANIVDSVGYSLKYDNESDGNFYVDFEKLCEAYPDIVEEIMHKIEGMNIDKAISDIENRVNNDLEEKTFEIPPVVGIWLNKLIPDRIRTMRCILNNTMEKRSRKTR